MPNHLLGSTGYAMRLVAIAATCLIAASSTLTPGVGAEAAPAPATYVVIVRTGTDSDALAREHAAQFGLSVLRTYRSAITGYSAQMDGLAASRVAADPRVRYVTLDVEQAVDAAFSSYDVNSVESTNPSPPQLASNGLRRIGGSTNGVNQTLKAKGKGVGVAVLDTGVAIGHPDLAPVGSGPNCFVPGALAVDNVGHGTFVAGIIAARDNSIGTVGVAPDASLYAVKVLQKKPNTDPVKTWTTPETQLCGVEWAMRNKDTIKVVNMSLKWEWMANTPPAKSNADCSNADNDVLHEAICSAVAAGLTFVVSAGNNAQDAATQRPAAYDEVIAVSAWSDTNGMSGASRLMHDCGDKVDKVTQLDETWATFTNFGSLVDIAAPGVKIRSTVPDGYAVSCGTSDAAPHVAGAAAVLLGKFPSWSPQQVKTWLTTHASPLPDVPTKHVEDLLDVSSL